MASILVVDDRLANREFLVTLLGYHKHRLLEASDGAEALMRWNDPRTGSCRRRGSFPSWKRPD